MNKPLSILFTVLIYTLISSCSTDIPHTNKPLDLSLFPNAVKPNTQMDTIQTDRFWTLIDNAVSVAKGDNSIKEKYLISELSKLSLEEIIDFEIAFRKVVIDADDFKIMAAQKIIEGYVSDDSYLYFRCWLIGKGSLVYTEALKSPEYLAGIAINDEVCNFESLMYVATKAYSIKTRKKEDETFPRNIAIAKGLDYDFFKAPTKGKDWTEDDLPKLYPKLWDKFN